MVEEVIERYALLGVEQLFFSFLLSLLNKLTRQSFVGYGVEHIARVRRFGKTRNFNRNGRTCFLQLPAVFVGHNANSAHSSARHYYISAFKRSVLNKQGSHRTSAFIEPCLNNNTLCLAVGVGFKLHNLGNQQDVFKQAVDSLVGLSRNGHAYNIAAPLFGNKTVLGQLLQNSVGISLGLIHFVYSNDYLNICRLCMVYSLNGLRHNTVVRRDNKHRNIGSHCAALTH